MCFIESYIDEELKKPGKVFRMKDTRGVEVLKSNFAAGDAR